MAVHPFCRRVAWLGFFPGSPGNPKLHHWLPLLEPGLPSQEEGLLHRPLGQGVAAALVTDPAPHADGGVAAARKLKGGKSGGDSPPADGVLPPQAEVDPVLPVRPRQAVLAGRAAADIPHPVQQQHPGRRA